MGEGERHTDVDERRNRRESEHGVKRSSWQHSVSAMMKPTTPAYALPFGIAVGEAMVGQDEPCDAADERRSGFAIQALYLVEGVAEAVRVNALPELRQVLRNEREPIPLGLGSVQLGDRLRAQIDSRWFLDFNWFLNFDRARDAFRANLHLLSDRRVAAAVSELVEHGHAT